MTWDIALVIGLTGMSFGLGFLSSIVDERHYALKLLLVLSSLFVYVGLAATLPQIVAASEAAIGVTIAGQLDTITNGVYKGFITVTLMATTYFMIYFLYEALKSMQKRREDGEE
jgi:hypothetical protein